MPNLGSVIDEFKKVVGYDNILQGKNELEAYTIDDVCPEVAVFPTDESQVGRILVSAHRENAVIIPRGHGTKMGMGGIPTRADIALSLEQLNSIIEFSSDDLTVTAQAGITLPELQTHLSKKKLFLPIDPPCSREISSPSPATLGGVVATNSNGPRRLKYNSLRDLILGMKVMLADGTTINIGGKTVKNVSGYDMTKLFIGSLGTLGVIIEITFRLLPLPETGQTLLVSFAELPQAANVVANILASELLPAAIELFSPVGAEMIGMPGEHFLLALDIEDVAEAVNRQSGQMKQICETEQAIDVSTVEGSERDALWGRIEDWPMLTYESDSQVRCKVSIPIGSVVETFDIIEEIAQQGELDTALMSHAGSGIIYAILTPQTRQARFEWVIENLVSRARQLGGSSTVEYAPTEIKRNIDVWGPPRSEIALMRRIKEQLDPKGLLNPGRFLGGI